MADLPTFYDGNEEDLSPPVIKDFFSKKTPVLYGAKWQNGKLKREELLMSENIDMS